MSAPDLRALKEQLCNAIDALSARERQHFATCLFGECDENTRQTALTKLEDSAEGIAVVRAYINLRLAAAEAGLRGESPEVL